MADDPYRILGVQKDATDAEIKRTYRKLARQHHPDRNPDDAAAEERFKAIQAAYDQIGTAVARKEYDQQRRMEEMFARGGNPFSGFGGGEWLKEVAKKKNYKVIVKNSTDQISNVSIQGPKSRKILNKIIFTPPTQPTIDELQWFRFTICRMDDLNGIPLVISRTGYTGELGYEVWCHPKDAPKVWDK